MTVAWMNVDVFDGKDLIGAQCFKHDLSAHSYRPGYVYESNAVTEAYF